MTPTTKNALLLVFLIAVCSYATDKWQFDYETGAGNFTKKERVATGVLNILPGVGSYFIMDDLTGAIVQWSLSGTGLVLFAAGFSIVYSINTGLGEAIGVFGLFGGIASSYAYNIYRSITYDKPKKTAYSENSGFNIAVLPNRNGKLNAFLMYNKAF